MSKLIIVLFFIFHIPCFATNINKIKFIQDKLIVGGDAPKMVIIPQGRFVMGSPKNVNSFAISETEVTFKEYDYYAKLTNKPLPKDYHGRNNMPVSGLSFVNASDYAKWLSEQTGYYYRLPTEAEWEYAARAGTQTPFHTGECIDGTQANFDDREKSKYADCTPSNIYLKKTITVASYLPNSYGLYDMHGNESEWIKD